MDDAVVAGGAPISTALPSLDGMFDLHGWQIMYIAEGIPTIVAGFATLFIMTDKPEPAKFLTAEEKAWLSAKLASERQAKEVNGKVAFRQVAGAASSEPPRTWS